MTADDYIERLKAKHPSLEVADQTYDQSHFWHTWFCLVAFGPVGVFWSIILARHDVARGFAIGVMGGVIGYVIREYRWRLASLVFTQLRPEVATPMHWWDSILDWVVPLAVHVPWTTAVLVSGAPFRRFAFTVWMVWVFIGWMYAFGRPRGAFRYGEGY